MLLYLCDTVVPSIQVHRESVNKYTYTHTQTQVVNPKFPFLIPLQGIVLLFFLKFIPPPSNSCFILLLFQDSCSGKMLTYHKICRFLHRIQWVAKIQVLLMCPSKLSSPYRIVPAIYAMVGNGRFCFLPVIVYSIVLSLSLSLCKVFFS